MIGFEDFILNFSKILTIISDQPNFLGLADGLLERTSETKKGGSNVFSVRNLEILLNFAHIIISFNY